MATAHVQPPFSTERMMSGLSPATPPYTPARSKRHFERADSPASFTSSIHPQETESPARKAARHSDTNLNDVKVEELAEGDLGYQTDIELVYPHELEEAESDHQGDTPSSSDNDDDEDEDMHADGITGRLSRMHCNDIHMTGQTRHHGMVPRTGSRVFKRSHSQSAKGDTSESADMDAMDDQNNPVSARRLRRRVRGPLKQPHLMNDVPRSTSEILRSPVGVGGPSRGYESAGMIDDSDDDDYDGLIIGQRRVTQMDLDDDSD